MFRVWDTEPRSLFITNGGEVEYSSLEKFEGSDALVWSTDCIDPVPVLKCMKSDGSDIYILNILEYEGKSRMYIVRAPYELISKANTRALRGCAHLLKNPNRVVCLGVHDDYVACRLLEQGTCMSAYKTGAWFPVVEMLKRKFVSEGDFVEVRCGALNDVFYMEDAGLLRIKEFQLAYVGLYLCKWKIMMLPVIIIFKSDNVSVEVKVTNNGTSAKPGLAYKIKERRR